MKSKTRSEIAIAFIAYDVLPVAVALGTVAFITLKYPLLLIGMIAGYLACKFQYKLLKLKDDCLKKIEELKSSEEDSHENE